MKLSSEFLDYLAETYSANEDCERLPSLHALSKQLGVSVSSLREQMEVARALGLVEAKPRTGIRRLPYSFTPAVEQSLFFALNLDPDSFLKFADLRQNLETAYWYQAVNLLTEDDQIFLQDLMGRAWAKLRGTPIKIPQLEHRQLRRLLLACGLRVRPVRD